MFARGLAALLIAATAALIAGDATADEAMVPLAMSGAWVAVAHRPSMIAPADTCMVINVDSGIAFRADGDGVQIRIINKSWSLPSGVKGKINVTVGKSQMWFDIGDNTDNMVMAEMGDDSAIELFGAMDKAASMTVSTGKAAPINVSLTGSTKATTAFRTCAGIKSSAAGPGSNPFK